ncbi:MAG: PilT/PilU family type 4a pilus ATPase [Thioalkalivibrionaceae bacterium]
MTDSAPLIIEPYFQLMAQKNASDLFFVAGAPPSIKVNGKLQPVSRKAMEPRQTERIARELMSPADSMAFEREHSANFAIGRAHLGRFRINVYRQRGDVAMVVRFIKPAIATLDQLGLPEVLKQLVGYNDGLILIVGSTGSGKSTTLAAMIDHRNSNQAGHILTVEDPIEFLFSHKQSIVGQREVGIDTPSYAQALIDGMREAPDVIMIGEIRTREVMQQAMNFSDTGHLVLSTLHATNATQALDRVVNMFPEEFRGQTLSDLSINLRAIVAQRLLRTVDGGRAAAFEILILTPYVSELIRSEGFSQIKEIMAKGSSVGMLTFDQSIYRLYKAGRVTLKEALAKADSRADLEWQINFGGQATATEEVVSDLADLPTPTNRG